MPLTFEHYVAAAATGLFLGLFAGAVAYVIGTMWVDYRIGQLLCVFAFGVFTFVGFAGMVRNIRRRLRKEQQAWFYGSW